MENRVTLMRWSFRRAASVLCATGTSRVHGDTNANFPASVHTKTTAARAPAPTREQVAALVERVAVRVRRFVGQPDPDAEPVSQAPALKIFGAEPEEAAAPPPRLAAEHEGFNLHAGIACEAHERVAIERLCRYILRGPLALGRLTKGPRGNLIYRLKTPKPDGTTHIVLSPLALLQRLSWLCVLPWAHTTHYHGVLAPAHPWRALVVPKQEEVTAPPLKSCGSRWIKWAELLKRVFLTDVLLCRLCGGERRIIAQIDEGPVARKVLAHLGLPTRLPVRTPARGQAQGRVFERQHGALAGWDTGPPDEVAAVDDSFDQPPPFDFDQRIPASDMVA